MGLALVFTRFVMDAREPEKMFTSIVAVAALMFALFTVVLVPVDVYNVSSTRDGDGELRLTPDEIDSRMTAVRDLYLVLYGAVMFFLFIAIPFAYFYYEEAHPDRTTNARVASACQYSFALVLVLVVLVVLGIVMSGSKPSVDDQATQDYLDALLESETKTEASISFSVAVMSLLGYLCMLTFTSCGFGAMPVAMIAGSIHLDKENADVTESLLTTKERARAIQSKYISGRKMTKKDQKALEMLRRSERQLTRRSKRITATRSTCWARTARFLRPLQVVFGVFFLLVSLFVVISLLLGGVDRLQHSICGYECGFVLASPRIANPFDLLMVKLSTVFPIDYILVTALFLYFFLGTAAGLIRVSIRCFCFVLFRVRKAATVPQGVLLSVVIISLSLMSLNIMFVQLSPQYALFGSQVYRGADGALHDCTLVSPVEEACTMSQLGRFVTRISIKYPALGVSFFAGNAAFILMFFASLLLASLKGKSSSTAWNGSSDDSDEFW